MLCKTQVDHGHTQQYLKGKPFESFTGDANTVIPLSIHGTLELHLQPQADGHQAFTVPQTVKPPHSTGSIRIPGSSGTPFPGQPGS